MRITSALFAMIAGLTSVAGGTESDWTDFAGTSAGTRYAPLAQITPANVHTLKLAWRYKLDAPKENVAHPYVAFEGTPLKVADTLYFCTPNNAVVALDADTGKPRWKFEPEPRKWGGFRACRGVAYYETPGATATAAATDTADCHQRIVTGTTDARLFAVDAKTGRPCTGFGEQGSVDLLTGLGDVKPGVYGITSAPTIVRGVIVLGGMVIDNGQVDNPSGVIRAFDAVTGKLAWAWDLGRPDVHTASGSGEQYTRNTPNGWAPFSGDESLGLVYVPTGNSNPDYYGAQRTAEAEKYSSAVVALDAATGTRRAGRFKRYITTCGTTMSHRSQRWWTYPHRTRSFRHSSRPPSAARSSCSTAATGHPLAPVVEKPVPQGGAPGDPTAPNPAVLCRNALTRRPRPHGSGHVGSHALRSTLVPHQVPPGPLRRSDDAADARTRLDLQSRLDGRQRLGQRVSRRGTAGPRRRQHADGELRPVHHVRRVRSRRGRRSAQRRHPAGGLALCRRVDRLLSLPHWACLANDRRLA